MKKIIGFVLILSAPFTSKAQDWHVGGILGISNYSGDLSEKRIDFRYTRPMVGIMVKRDINRFLTLRAGFSYGNIAGADSTNRDTSLMARNLSFRSNIWEGQLGAELNILDIDDKGYTPYVFAGVSLFSFYPWAKDAAGNKVPLRRLSTEGQGMPQYPERGNQYALHQVSIPFGAGFKYLFTDRWTIGIEVGLRATFTDYLDDVSTTYIDQNTLLAERGQQAVDMAYRGDEVTKLFPGTYPLDGTQRGSAKYKDWYVFSGLTFMYRLGGSDGLKKTNFSRCFKM
ncbi:type IX secretion system protein PorG [Chitinophaga lutea]